MLATIKRAVVGLLGRDRANRLAAPYHDRKARRRTRQRLATLATKDLCVNIGCGPNALPDWINLDRARGDAIDIVWDICNGLPFPAESCTAIFAEHVIEHVTKDDAFRLLRECHRVLQRGGVIRLSTPDAGRYLRAYAVNDDFLYHPAFELPIETPMDRINQMMREYGQHLWTYDVAALTLMLKQAGFTKVGEQEFGTSVHPRMRGIDSEARAFESMYVEGIK